MNSSEKKPALTLEDYRHLANFRHALRRFLRFSEDAAIAAGVPPHQHQALLAIKGFTGPGERMTIGALAERLQIAPHSAVGLVNRLLKEELIAKQQGTSDRRQMHLVLAPRGEEILAKLSAVHREELRRVGPQLRTLLGLLAGGD